ncbi:MAG: DUF1611 domain-containing protein [Xanthomonadales bacterium]|nr:DUF1611 domain-containing protein [Xanthomonadales bacterium]
MSELTRVQLRPPYLILIGELTDATYAKTGQGIVQWRPDLVIGQLRLPGCTIDLGVPDLTVAEARKAGVGSLIIGVAPIGGRVPDSWWAVIEEAAASGLDVVNGLHIRLGDHARVAAAARASGARLIDVRVPPPDLPVGTGIRRSGRRILTVAGDCAIGKKFTALELDRSMREAGMNSTYRATGQTGIMIAGEGIPIDAVVADFISGAAEMLSPSNDPDHWDVIEGQGSIFHPGYSAVSLGLLHGSQPDGIVVCHDPARSNVVGWEHYKVPALRECIETHLSLGRRINPDIRCVGISVNTSSLMKLRREEYLAELSAQTGLPCVDPLIDGCHAITQHIRNTTER